MLPHDHHLNQECVLPTTKTDHRSLVSLKLPSPIPDLITFAEGVVRSLTGNPSFPTPTPTIAAISAAIADLQSAQAAALSRAKGTAVVRDEKKTVLIRLLQQLKGYVQTVADANLENSASIITSAGLAVRKAITRAPRVFAAESGTVSGSVKLLVPSAGHRSGYEWSYSTDGGHTWVQAPFTLQAKTVITGLGPATTVQFRHRAVTKGGEGDWSQVISFIVR